MSNSLPSARLPASPNGVVHVRTIGLSDIPQWLVLAWRDLRRSGWVSWLHGGLMAFVGALMLWVAHDQFWLLAGAFSGFLLVAPILSTSLYALSDALERGQAPSLAIVLQTWLKWRNGRLQSWGDAHWRLLKFGVLLAGAGTLWVLVSASLITLLSAQPIATPRQFLEFVVLAKDGFLFEMWLCLGGVLVAPIFASTVVTVPLLLDRQLTIKAAVASSWQAVLANPVPLALWGAVIMLLTMLGFAFALFGLVLVVPLLGHASWHAYRGLIDASGLPENPRH